MKFLLIYLDAFQAAEDWRGAYSHGVGYLLSSLKQSGQDVSFYHVIRIPERDEFLEYVKSQSPDAIGFSSTSNMYTYARQLAAWLREDPGLQKIEMLMGGVHPTLAPDDVLNEGLFDIICTGEGEAPLTDYCRLRDSGRSVSEVPNLWGRENGNIFRNPRRPLPDLDGLPFPARQEFQFQNLHHMRQGVAAVMASRGCTFSCNYCCNHALRALTKGLGRYTRFRSVDNVIAELKLLKSTYPHIKRFAFQDDNLPLYQAWFSEFCDKYPGEIGMPYSCNLHPSLADEKVVQSLADTGCVRIDIGLESGNDHIRREVLGRKLDIETFTAAMHRIREAGITLCTNNIIGIPGEGIREMLETVKLNSEIGTEILQLFIFYPFPKTRLYQVCKERGLLTGQEHQDFNTKSILKMSAQKKRRVYFIRDYFSPLVKLYRKLYSKGRAGRLAAGIMDAVIQNKLTFRILYPHTTGCIHRLKSRMHLRRDESRRGCS
jgi:anaerobic magnesium-protoporphyrin IX monomethyl ester cyclase